MNLSICTISFRHGLQSIEQITDWAVKRGFDGIELWGTHARHLASDPECNGSWLRSIGLSVPMLSDYLPLEQSWDEVRAAAIRTFSLANHWKTNHVRIFAGGKSSLQTTNEERSYIAAQLHRLCHLAEDTGLRILLETHPRTLCDTLPSTLQLLAEVNHRALHVNFDVLHVWESGVDVNLAFQQLQPFIKHMHLKNITSPAHLDVFIPENVFSSSGSRKGMTSLFRGCIDYKTFFAMNDLSGLNASLEWFGPHPFEILEEDGKQLLPYRKQKLYH